MQGFFSIFYASINAGSLISTILTPILRLVTALNSKANGTFMLTTFGLQRRHTVLWTKIMLSGRVWGSSRPYDRGHFIFLTWKSFEHVHIDYAEREHHYQDVPVHVGK